MKFYVEDLERVARWLDPAQALSGSCWPPWTQCKDSQEYMDEMDLFNVSLQRFVVDPQLRLAKMSSDAAWRLHVAQNHQP